ncbi:hypothetical protein H5U98_04030 [Mycolicibacterium boenickei]|uniref:Mce associated membrane protein n=1 Tax=Mycolicibacterium boenickei TaxID=146017 RepID=A0AAX2ZZ97_9MYCO|nr:hypothetical protein [Mycolicibacterium boenickei]UNC00620.1 hypothetical protein H5U98_04030 [Mycolicibacterium boenickei]BBX90387.1 hypothetical protein MBOE_20360 [Mycolicibacterium boenickei]
MRLLSRSDQETDQETEAAVLDDAVDVTPSAESETDDPGDAGEAPREKRSRRPRLATLLAGAAILVSGALIAAGGYVIWYHQQADREQQRRAEFAAAASQAAVTLMSIDSATAQDNVRQILDNSTGQFKADIESSSEDLVKAAQDSKATTKATVGASAVQSMDGDSAVVLVSTSTTVSNSAGANQQPRNWRLSVTMVKDGEQIKMSKVEFIP